MIILEVYLIGFFVSVLIWLSSSSFRNEEYNIDVILVLSIAWYGVVMVLVWESIGWLFNKLDTREW